ncbi:hypothetical protein [Candidatus Planktophila versatilis]|uniref:hypothetical protein n=1 Tax=Candidatus Planktophila versatilis TaxID=1884905 RepID=UPI000BAC93D8|nr:hypothetical protein [Candidatus Planktophila versatilis]ASY26183.1 hypothetical protein A1sIIB142_01990 [Candidatus Planktophila versatilis]
MTGKQIKERLERDLGFEANRARLLTEAAASIEISTYWERKGLGKLDEKTYSALAKAALVSGLAGRQKLSDMIYKLATSDAKNIDLPEVVIEISALVLEHQKTLNLSRNRASCVNAHLNILEPDRSLPQVYSPFLSTDELKKVVNRSNAFLKKDVSNAADFYKWIKETHDLLSDVSAGEIAENDEEDFSDGISKKGLISRKAITTYLKQWELFATEKLGPTFSIEIKENHASPLTGKLNNLEDGASRTWTTMLGDITEARTSAVFQKRATAVTNKGTSSAALQNVDNYDLEISGRPLKIQLTPGVSEDVISQFVKAMKAQFLVYAGKGLLNVSLQSGNTVVTASLSNASKQDLKKIEEVLLQLI